MDVIDRIVDQIDAVGLPLFAVTLTALPRANTPVLLALHWHGFGPDPLAGGGARGAVPRKPVPASAMQLNAAWDGMTRLDQAMLDAAWQLGAWELEREERRGADTAGASDREALECRQAFCEPSFAELADPLLLVEAPDRPEMLRLGARLGYVQWKFRPVRGGVWRDTADDDTLAADGGRIPPCPIHPQAPIGTRVGRTRYRLGRINRILLAG